MHTPVDYGIDQAIFCQAVQAGVRRAASLDRPILVSVTARLAWLDPLDLFGAARKLGHASFYWEHPASEMALVGVGQAQVIEQAGAERFARTAAAWQAVRDQALIIEQVRLPGSGPTLLGGFAFDAEQPSTPVWQAFAAASLVLPAVQLTTKADAAALTWNMMVDGWTDADQSTADLQSLTQELLALASLRPRRSAPAQALTINDLLPAATWQATVAATAAAVAAGAYTKVALARAVQVEASSVFDVEQALRQLRQSYPAAYVFAVERGAQCFIGATPERLVGLRAGLVQATGLAGTARRGATPAEDQALGAELLASSKNRHEHAVVVEMLRSALAAVCAEVEAAETPTLLKLSNVQHLYTPVVGRLRAQHTLLDLVAQLHPTPAVGGLPSAAALAHIRACEGLDRGWYAGPIGWIDAQGEGDFAVALRCGLVAEHQARLFAGCGIMGDSNAAHEYTETCLKLRPMLQALGAELG